ncbi:protein kinase [Tolypothrix sp. PCC 7910]|uniref:serine/threonine-protein kinase n=1 Tax=Tolypothrix sp. PCC 7910 TaxID=2099387 RepID=UPI0014279C2C|nr:serine/threonine-protein kinase [Tolypothrix sp. PCC 7910]QIR35753.1 protein kinase [Tolypothrix sp. PCC 7910]
MICCLNSSCHNPPNPDGTEFCSNCGVPLVVLRHYRPIRVLGSGGFGKTYLAEDVEKFNELCVIKQFAPQIQGTGALQKATELFEQEARRLQQLGEHPQIPTLLAYFEQNQRLYLVQQFIDGENLLDELQQQGTFNEQKIRELLLELLNILTTVHQQKVIHRDIKPQNILRRKLSATKGNIILIDFGASKQLSETVMTQQGTTIGSFGYAPLEQMQDGQVYPASDLYSLGATCFHLLTGVAPWELWKQQGYGWVANWRQHSQQSVSPQLAIILDKLLQPNYEERYQSAAAVLQDINDVRSSSEMPATVAHPRPVSTPQQLPATVAYQPLVSIQRKGEITSPTVVDLAKPKQHFKIPLLLSGAILLLSLGGYGVWQVRKPLLTHTIAYEKLALANSLIAHTEWVNSLAISADGETLVSGSADKSIKIWNLKAGELKTTLTLHSNVVNSVAISPDSKTVVSASKDGTIKIWNLPTGTLKATLPRSEARVNSVVISPDGQNLVSGGGDNKIKIWNLQTGELKNILNGHNNSVMALAISSDGQTLASGSADSTIKIWNLQTGELKNTLTGHKDVIFAVAISPDGKTLVSGSYDRTIKIWNLQTGDLKNTLTEHRYAVSSVAISPDGQTLATGSWDNTIKIWNLQTGALKTTLTGHSDLVYTVAISPDGKTLVSGSKDKTVKIWRVPE